MAIFAIADLHLSLGTDKPMDIFRGWQDYEIRIKQNWQKLITDEDTVVLPGDISWAMKLEDCYEDFKWLESLPGKKIILKGNHDYWWATMRKMNTYLEENNFNSISFLLNDSYFVEDVAICGTRSWLFDESEVHDEKIMNREVGRLRASLESAKDKEKLVFLHYPPVYPRARAEKILDLLKEYDVKKCFYGHLHGVSILSAIQGEYENIEYKLVSADALGFCPYKIK